MGVEKAQSDGSLRTEQMLQKVDLGCFWHDFEEVATAKVRLFEPWLGYLQRKTIKTIDP